MSTLWGRTRDEVLRRTGELGRQVALGLVEAMQRALAGDRRVHVLGGWPQVFEALGVPAPSGKAARAALAILASATSAVVRVTSHTWRVVSHAVDVATAEQLDLAWDPKGKGESGPVAEPAPPQPAPRRTLGARARARASQLEQAFGREPAHPAARRLAAQVLATGALEGRELWSITLTAAELGTLEETTRRFAEDFDEPGLGLALVPELSPVGRLHYHGFLVCNPTGGPHSIRDQWWELGGGTCDVQRVWDVRRLRYWAGYALKHPAGGKLKTLTAGRLAAPTIGRPAAPVEPHEAAPTEGRSGVAGLLGRAREALAGAWRRWSR